MNKEYIAKKKLREFGILIAIFFPLFIGYFIPLCSGQEYRLWTFYIAVPFLIFGIIKPQLLLFPYKLWLKLVFFVGWIISRIIFGLVFFVFLLPISLMLRIFGYDPLKKKKLKKSSYREYNKKNKIDLTRTF